MCSQRSASQQQQQRRRRLQRQQSNGSCELKQALAQQRYKSDLFKQETQEQCQRETALALQRQVIQLNGAVMEGNVCRSVIVWNTVTAAFRSSHRQSCRVQYPALYSLNCCVLITRLFVSATFPTDLVQCCAYRLAYILILDYMQCPVMHIPHLYSNFASVHGSTGSFHCIEAELILFKLVKDS
jgi:hypothetical protein